jgi:hypothetical protein
MKIALLILMLASSTQEVVEAAKEAKARRKKPSTKVLTNKDVKNSKGKLIMLPGAEGEEAEQKKVDGPSPLEQHDLNYHARRDLEKDLEVAQANVTELEKELQHLENQYYEENDPDRRDKVIRTLFEEVKGKLQEARAELDELTPESREPTPESQP